MNIPFPAGDQHKFSTSLKRKVNSMSRIVSTIAGILLDSLGRSVQAIVELETTDSKYVLAAQDGSLMTVRSHPKGMAVAQFLREEKKFCNFYSSIP